LFLILLVVVVAGGTQVAYNRGLINSHQLESAPFGKMFLSLQSGLNLGELNLSFANKLEGLGGQSESGETTLESTSSSQEAMITSAKEQGTTLFSRGQEMISHVQRVLGDYVEVNEEEQQKSLGEKTLEYTRYQYCKQVIEEFENKSASSPAAEQVPENN